MLTRKMRIVRLYSENSFNIKELLINTEVINKSKNEELEKENRNLHSLIKFLFDKIKTFFRSILLKGNENSKELATQGVKE